MRTSTKALAGILIAGFVFLVAAPVTEAGDLSSPRRWTVGTQAGIQARTVSGSIFTMGANIDLALSPKFSMGPMGFASSGIDLTEYGVALAGRYHIDKGSWKFVPFAGIGALRAEFKDEKSTGLLVPIGITAEYFLEGNVFTGTLMINVHDLEFDTPPGRDRGSVAFMLGVRL
jgi:hypothetical protein